MSTFAKEAENAVGTLGLEWNLFRLSSRVELTMDGGAIKQRAFEAIDAARLLTVTKFKTNLKLMEKKE